MSQYTPLYTEAAKTAARPSSCCTTRLLYGLALGVSVVSWTTCVILLSSGKNVVDTYTFDSRLSLFISRNESDFCGNKTVLHESACPSDVLHRFTSEFERSPCTQISPLESTGTGVVEVKWGDNSFTRYPLPVDSKDSAKFWGIFLSHANSLVLLLFVFTISALFQLWRFLFLKTPDNDLLNGEMCPYDLCQYNPASENTWTQTLQFRPSHGSQFSMWLEFTFTASIQLLVISFNFQGFNVNELWFIVLIQGCLTLLGYIVEDCFDKLYMPCKHQHPRPILFGEVRHLSVYSRALCIEILAWFLHASLWTSLFSNYENVKQEIRQLKKISSHEQCRHSHDIPEVPAFVEAIIYSQFLFYTLFGLVQFLQFSGFTWYNLTASWEQAEPGYEDRWRQNNLYVWKKSALAYAVLNVVSKACLAFILVFGTVME